MRTSSDTLHHAVAIAVTDLQALLSLADVSNFRLDIEISGRVHGGDILVTYKMGERYSSNSPEGSRLEAVVQEFLRRRGWEARNAPLALEAPESHVNDDLPPAVEPPVLTGADSKLFG